MKHWVFYTENSNGLLTSWRGQVCKKPERTNNWKVLLGVLDNAPESGLDIWAVGYMTLEEWRKQPYKEGI